jgi:HD-like signal output (HDOD) protein/ActR/RegA family two-component response regulator
MSTLNTTPPPKARILFVDDEAPILDGLRDLLRKERRRWDMEFAQGGAAALAELAKAPFDVVVSDMRMPGIDGAELLGRVKAEYPGTARIVLSGHAEREAILRALPVAHQFLSKPCDATTLRVAIDRTLGLTTLLRSPELRAAVGRFESLPSVPHTYLALTQAAQDPTKGISDMAGIVQRDPAMSSKVLQLVNSAYFGSSQRVASIQQAVMYLGFELLKGLALTGNVFAAGLKMPAGFSLETLQEHSLRTACLAKGFVDAPKQADEAFTAALVHDVGQIVIATGLPKAFEEIATEARASGRPLHVVETEQLGVSHAEIGAYLLGVWGLPFSIVEGVAYHHRPSDLGDGPCEILAALHAADALVDATPDHPLEAALDLGFLERAKVLDRLPRWQAFADEVRGRADAA